MYGTDYYKKLFGPGSGQIELHVEDLIHRAKLVEMFCLEEIREAIYQMKQKSSWPRWANSRVLSIFLKFSEW
jgi:hypothetical protein